MSFFQNGFKTDFLQIYRQTTFHFINAAKPVTDPGFPREWRQPLILEQTPIIWQYFCQKLRENGTNWTEKGAWVSSTPLVSPMKTSSKIDVTSISNILYTTGNRTISDTSYQESVQSPDRLWKRDEVHSECANSQTERFIFASTR